MKITPFEAIRIIVINVLVLILILIFAEGALSWFFAFKEALQKKPMAESMHTRFDPQLGWTSIENVKLDDFYGPGLYVKTDDRGLRGDDSINDRIPAGSARVICSGDSFTFGYGVSNTQTWCHLLGETVPHIESVNFGLGGYGLDQSYLRYKELGPKLEHTIHIIAFIGDDFRRMESTNFLGFAKPHLRVISGQIEADNLPLEDTSKVWAPIYIFLKPFEKLSFVRFARLIGRQFPSGNRSQFQFLRDPNTPEVALTIIEDLNRIAKAQGATLLAVYLPIRPDYTPNESDQWRNYFKETLLARGIKFIDLVETLRTKDKSMVKQFFIADSAVPKFASAAGHYSAVGNSFVADALRGPVREAVSELGLS